MKWIVELFPGYQNKSERHYFTCKKSALYAINQWKNKYNLGLIKIEEGHKHTLIKEWKLKKDVYKVIALPNENYLF